MRHLTVKVSLKKPTLTFCQTKSPASIIDAGLSI